MEQPAQVQLNDTPQSACAVVTAQLLTKTSCPFPRPSVDSLTALIHLKLQTPEQTSVDLHTLK